MGVKMGSYYFIDLDNVQSICRGDKVKMLRYLNQFNELIPQRKDYLKLSLMNGDRFMIRQILHKMSPQLQFFGIKGVTIPIQRMEFEYETIPINELEILVNDIIFKLEGAIKEVSNIIDSNFE